MKIYLQKVSIVSYNYNQPRVVQGLLNISIHFLIWK